MTGKLLLLLGPSGSGKGTVMEYLKKNFPEFKFPPSYTTREMRPGEVEGEVYHFVSEEEFKRKISEGKFLEWAIVHEDNYYGTKKEEILDALEAGQNVAREVDVQGVKSIRKILGKENVITLFITTPSWEELKERILSRADMTDEELKKREESYKDELKFAEECDYKVENQTGKLGDTLAKIYDIVNAI